MGLEYDEPYGSGPRDYPELLGRVTGYVLGTALALAALAVVIILLVKGVAVTYEWLR